MDVFFSMFFFPESAQEILMIFYNDFIPQKGPNAIFSYRCLAALIYIYLQVIQTYIYTQIPIPGWRILN